MNCDDQVDYETKALDCGFAKCEKGEEGFDKTTLVECGQYGILSICDGILNVNCSFNPNSPMMMKQQKYK